MSMNSTVLILGAGPSGLAIAHAANMAGRSFEIYSKGGKSELYGCQYLHRPISLTIPAEYALPVPVQFHQLGEPRDYMLKVYQQSWDGGTPDRLGTQHNAWDLRATYNELWKRYGDFVTPCVIDQDWIHYFRQRSDVEIYSTIPANQICTSRSHTFASVSVWGIGDAPELGQVVPLPELAAPSGIPLRPNLVVCNGKALPEWYRLSNVYGHATVEWPGWRERPDLPGVVRVVKPLWTNCDCWPEIKKLGRRGAWHRREHIHTVFAEAARIFGLSI